MVVGRVGRAARASAGEVRWRSAPTSPSGGFARGGPADRPPRRAARSPIVAAAACTAAGCCCSFEGVEDRTAAEALRGTSWSSRSTRPSGPRTTTSATTTSWSGSTPSAPSTATPLGTVDRGRCTCPSQDVLVVRDRAGAEVLVPFVAAIVPEVDVAGGRVVVDPPGGLLERRDVSAVRVDVVTIFPEYLAPLSVSLHRQGADSRPARRARPRPARLDPRPAPHRRRHPVRRRPGHGHEPEPWGEALDAVRAGRARAARAPCSSSRRRAGGRSPSRSPRSWPREPGLVFACGRYEGIDRRVARRCAHAGSTSTRSSLGDYVLAGGEVAVLVIVEAVARLLPGVLGNAESAGRRLVRRRCDGGLLEGPVYTKPPRGAATRCPRCCSPGDHGAIAAWRRDAGAAPHGRGAARPGRARSTRPAVDAADLAVLAELGWVPGDGRGFRAAAGRLWQTDSPASPVRGGARAVRPTAPLPQGERTGDRARRNRPETDH